MNWHQVSLDSVAATPWRNGGGTTRELLAWPNADEWTARVSVADVAAGGPFSSYPGVARWFAVLSGEGVTLRVEGREHVLGRESQPFSFDGASATDCALRGGATEDFNLMLRGRDGVLERVQGQQERNCRKGSIVGVYSHEHEIAFRAVEVRIVIPPRTLAWHVVPRDERVDFATDGALWFEVQP
ncbi:HutD/Ves family protein [Ramlibacter sp. PS4R-6]|uniref:HutD/Ves family protein n=1 Tax=Ramlibacter sp. PS4R-6 TaxID=3133438 RepID=UPI00309A4F8C